MAFNGIIDFMIRRRLVVLGVIGLISLGAAWYAAKVAFDISIEIWFLKDDPSLVTYHQFLKRFNADEISVVGVFAEDVFAPDTLATIDRLTRKFEGVPYAYRVRSITNLRVATATEGGIAIAPLVSHFPVTIEEAEAIRKKALANPILAGSFVTKDTSAAAIVVELDPKGATLQGKTEQVQALEQIRREEAKSGVRMVMSGNAVFDATFDRLTKQDFNIFVPLILALVILCCYIVYRRLSGAIIPLSVVGLASLWTFGAMGFFGYKMNPLSLALVGVILAVGVASSIHILSDYYQELMKGHPPDKAVRTTIYNMLTPCFFTSATTVAGMLSLLVSNLKPIREFGVFSALAITFSFLLTFSLVPVVLRLAKPPAPDFIERQRNGPMHTLLQWLGRPGRRWSQGVMIGSAVLVIAGAWIGTHLSMGSNPMQYFRKNSPLRAEAMEIDHAFGGSTTIEFVVRTPEGGLLEPDVLQRMDRFEGWLKREIGIADVFSFADTLKEMNRVFHEGDASWYRLPESRALAAQYALLMEGEDDFESYVQEDYSVGRITARITLTEDRDYVAELPKVLAQLEKEFPPPLAAQATGFLRLMADMEVYMLASQIKSFLLAFLVVSSMMVVLLRSVKLGLFAMIPNLTPIVLGLAFMVLVGITLNPGTVMIGSIALGLVVDDTVHFLVRLRRHVKEGIPLEEAIYRTMTGTGRAIIITSVVLACAFLVLVAGNFGPNIHFGGVSAVIIAWALAGDLVMLPASLIILKPKI